MSRAPRVDWRFVTLCAAILAFLFGTQAWLNALETQQELSFGFALVRAASAWGGWLLLAPLIFRAGGSNPLGADSRIRWVGKHLWLATAFAVAHSALQAVFRELLGIPIAGGLIAAFVIILGVNFAGDVLRYSLISLAYQAFVYHKLVRERDREAARLQLDLAEAKLAALEGRLRPHFLFNTLNAIAALIREAPSAAEAMIGQLSDLLRASLKADPLREVALGDELALVEQYLAIEHARFHERLTAQLEATGEARLGYVPHLILQPIVENAVRHGIASRETGGRIWVKAEQAGDRLVVVVEDDGVGIGNAPRDLAGGGVGLGSVKSRLAHLYGSEQSFHIGSRYPAGTRVRIDIPYRAAEKPVVELRG